MDSLASTLGAVAGHYEELVRPVLAFYWKLAVFEELCRLPINSRFLLMLLTPGSAPSSPSVGSMEVRVVALALRGDFEGVSGVHALLRVPESSAADLSNLPIAVRR
jgi:hypothetical protein